MTKKKKQISNKSKHRVSLFRRPWMVFIILLALIVIVFVCLFYFKPKTDSATEPSQPEPTINVNPDQPEQSSSETTAKQEEPEDKTTQYEGEDPNTLDVLTGSIARKTVADGKLTVVASIDQYLSEPGVCTIEIKNTKGDIFYTASVDATPDVTTSICEPFVIPTNRLGAGKFNISIQIKGDNKQGSINEEVEL